MKTEIKQFRLDKEEDKKSKKLCKKIGITFSEYIRSLMLKDFKVRGLIK